MRKIKVVVLFVRQLQHGFKKIAKVSPNLTVAQIQTKAYEINPMGSYVMCRAYIV